MASIFTTDTVLAEIKSTGTRPRLLLHCCCAPCASYVLECLSPLFAITCLFYNPNIMPEKEHNKRLECLNKLIVLSEYPNNVEIKALQYSPEDYISSVAPFPDGPEGGLRCRACIEIRLEETAMRATAFRYDYFTTTLSVSPHKNAALINEIGQYQAARFGGRFLTADFKKKDGYKRSVELSKLYGLYRQDYCGCGR